MLRSISRNKSLLIFDISKGFTDLLTSFGKYLEASAELFDIKIKGEQAILVKTFPNFKKCFCIVFLIKIKKSFFIQLGSGKSFILR